MVAHPAGKMASQISDDYNAEFADIIAREWPELQGRQSPQTLICSDGGDFTHSRKALTLAGRFGIKLMPWQRRQVMLALAVDADGRWLHPDVVLLCPRQNGKSLILEVVILYRLFVLNHQIVFTAHQWKTAKSIRNRIWRKIKAREWAQRRLVRNTASAGEAEMETAGGGKIQFTTRSNDAGRGFDQIDLLLLDEAYNLDSGELDAMAPTQLAAEDPQTFYTSSAVNSDKHVKGEELSKVRDRAVSGEAEFMLFSEFCAPEGMDPNDPETWKLANPSYGVVATFKKTTSLKHKLTAIGFEVEILGWGRWFDLSEQVGDDEHVIKPDIWQKLSSGSPEISGDSTVAIEVTPNGENVGMVSAQRTANDGAHLSLNQMIDFDRDEVVAASVSAVAKNDPIAFAVDPIGQVSTLIDLLRKKHIAPEKLTGGQVAAAFELFLRLIAEGKISHDGEQRWLDALEVVKAREGKFRCFDRFSGDVTVLIAASIAVWALQEYEIPETAPPLPTKHRFIGTARAVEAAPMAAMSF